MQDPQCYKSRSDCHCYQQQRIFCCRQGLLLEMGYAVSNESSGNGLVDFGVLHMPRRKAPQADVAFAADAFAFSASAVSFSVLLLPLQPMQLLLLRRQMHWLHRHWQRLSKQQQRGCASTLATPGGLGSLLAGASIRSSHPHLCCNSQRFTAALTGSMTQLMVRSYSSDNQYRVTVLFVRTSAFDRVYQLLHQPSQCNSDTPGFLSETTAFCWREDNSRIACFAVGLQVRKISKRTFEGRMQQDATESSWRSSDSGPVVMLLLIMTCYHPPFHCQYHNLLPCATFETSQAS